MNLLCILSIHKYVPIEKVSRNSIAEETARSCGVEYLAVPKNNDSKGDPSQSDIDCDIYLEKKVCSRYAKVIDEPRLYTDRLKARLLLWTTSFHSPINLSQEGYQRK